VSPPVCKKLLRAASLRTSHPPRGTAAEGVLTPGRAAVAFGPRASAARSSITVLRGKAREWQMTSGNDPYNLQRFVDAQNALFEQVCAELREGRKQGHWMWFIFPQLQGLGNSEMAVHFAISGRQEAEMYLKHPVLGRRIRECTRLVSLIEGR
jgi:hypothetical protein